jgi:tRNA G18 (ribose-2'-O)-methylase SpoU
MNLTTIKDLNIPQLQIYRHLRDNAVTKDNSFIADSPLVVNILLKTPIEVKSILATQKYYDENRELIEGKKIPHLYVADKKLMKEIVGHTIHHGVMMHGIRPIETPINELDDKIIMLDLLSKTDNVGSISRSAAALGINSFLVPSKGPHPYGRRALRVSMGHVSKLKIHTYDDIFHTLKTLKESGYMVFAAEITKDAINLQDVKIPVKWVLLMGDEAHGISNEVLQACDEVVKIEMSKDIKSFNVATAASIMMYQFINAPTK